MGLLLLLVYILPWRGKEEERKKEGEGGERKKEKEEEEDGKWDNRGATC